MPFAFGIFQRRETSALPRSRLDTDGGTVALRSHSFSSMVAQATDYDLTQIGSRERRVSFDISALDMEQSFLALEKGMRATLDEIIRNGLRALIVLQSPILLNDRDGRALDAPECISRQHDEDKCSMALTTHRKLSEATNRVLTRVASEFKNVTTFNPTSLLCTETRCPARLSGIIAYTDYEHLSATMSRRLTPSFAPYLAWLTSRDP